MSSSALVLGKTPASKETLLKDIKAAYLDNLVTPTWLKSWKQLNAGVGPGREVVQKVLRETSCRRSSSTCSPTLHPLIAFGVEKVKKGSKPWSQDTDNDMSLSSQYGYHNVHSDLPLFVHDCFVKLTVTQEGSQLVTQCYLKQIKLLIYILGRLWFN